MLQWTPGIIGKKVLNFGTAMDSFQRGCSNHSPIKYIVQREEDVLP